MLKRIRFAPLAALVVAVGLLVAPSLHADDPSPDAFYGRYEGVGVTRDPNVEYFEFGLRDLDVEIGADGAGFYVQWTTVIHDLGADGPRRKSARVGFDPTDRPGIYLARDAAAGVAHGLGWAAIDGATLSVRLLAIRDDGGYDIQTYHRTLEDSVMWLQFISDNDGQTIRTVNARLEKRTD